MHRMGELLMPKSITGKQRSNDSTDSELANAKKQAAYKRNKSEWKQNKSEKLEETKIRAKSLTFHKVSDKLAVVPNDVEQKLVMLLK